MRSLNIGATGMLAQQLNVEVISNNIANMTTTGYKRQRAEFQDLLYQNMRRVGSASSDAGTIVPTGVQLGLGAGERVFMSGQFQRCRHVFQRRHGRDQVKTLKYNAHVIASEPSQFILTHIGQIASQSCYPAASRLFQPTHQHQQ